MKKAKSPRKRRPKQLERDPHYYSATFRIPPELDRAIEIRCTALDITKRAAAIEAFERWLGPRHVPEPWPRPQEISDKELDQRALSMEHIERVGREEDWAA